MFDAPTSRLRSPGAARIAWPLLLMVLVLLASGAGRALAAPPPDAPSLEEGGYLERFRGDLEGAERIYRALLRKEEPREVRAEAHYRLGALLVRRGSPEGAPLLRSLAQEFPERKDLAARAEAALAQRGDPTVSGEAPPAAEAPAPAAAEDERTPPAGRIVARRTDGLFALARGGGDALEAGRRCDVLREGRAVGTGLVLRLTDALGAAKLLSGEAAPGDQVGARPAATTATAAAPEAIDGALLESARIFLDAIAASAQARPWPRDRPETVTGASAAPAILLEARAIGAEASFVERLPFVFERAPAPRPPASAAEEGALLSRLTAETERLLVERLLGAPDARVYRAERTSLRPGTRVEVSLAAPVAPRASVRLGLRLEAEPPRRPGAPPPEDVLVEVDLSATERPREPALFPGADGPIALAAPRTQRLRALVRLSRDRPAVVLAGLHDPFADAGVRRELLVTLSFARPPPEGLDR